MSEISIQDCIDHIEQRRGLGVNRAIADKIIEILKEYNAETEAVKYEGNVSQNR